MESCVAKRRAERYSTGDCISTQSLCCTRRGLFPLVFIHSLMSHSGQILTRVNVLENSLSLWKPKLYFNAKLSFNLQEFKLRVCSDTFACKFLCWSNLHLRERVGKKTMANIVVTVLIYSHTCERACAQRQLFV